MFSVLIIDLQRNAAVIGNENYFPIFFLLRGSLKKKTRIFVLRESVVLASDIIILRNLLFKLTLTPAV